MNLRSLLKCGRPAPDNSKPQRRKRGAHPNRVLPASVRRTAPSSARLPQARAGMDFSIKEGKKRGNPDREKPRSSSHTSVRMGPLRSTLAAAILAGAKALAGSIQAAAPPRLVTIARKAAGMFNQPKPRATISVIRPHASLPAGRRSSGTNPELRRWSLRVSSRTRATPAKLNSPGTGARTVAEVVKAAWRSAFALFSSLVKSYPNRLRNRPNFSIGKQKIQLSCHH
jgi:hypothetical protein